MRIDAHCHVSDVWYEPAETLLFQMDRCGVDRAALIQLLGQYDNIYQQDCARRWPDRFVSVVAVDPADPEAIGAFERLVDDGAHGVRLRPQARSAGDDPLAIWRAAARLKLPVSCVGPAAAFAAEAFAKLLAEVDDLDVVIEHLGGVARPDAEADAEKVFALAAHPRVYLKVPGLGQLAPRAQPLVRGEPAISPEAAAPILRAVAAFGANRLMWGSDFPPVASREGYTGSLHGVETALAHLTAAERDDIMGGVAARVFGID